MATGILTARSARKALRSGYRAWVDGQLDRAQTELRAAIDAQPDLPGAACYLARVLCELGRSGDGAALLDGVPAGGAGSDVAGIFRAIIAYDSGDLDTARDLAARLPQTNAIVGALGPLVDLRERLGGLLTPPAGPMVAPVTAPVTAPVAASVAATLPVAARWIADVAGRVLAVLEEAFWRVLPAEALGLHHGHYTGYEAGTGTGGGDTTLAPAGTQGSGAPPEQADPPPPKCRKEWETRLDEAFAEGRFDLVEELCRRRDVPEEWKGLDADLCRAFSLLALGKEARALEVLARRERTARLPPDGHFIRGLCHARSGQIAPAGWAFARAARSTDITCDETIQKVSLRLRVAWTYTDG